MQITEQYILMQAPNAKAADNGRKLSQKGNFGNLGKNAEENVYWGECSGSGKNPYKTSIDWSISENAPTCRCSCPSRQFPCKHSLGLMFDPCFSSPYRQCVAGCLCPVACTFLQTQTLALPLFCRRKSRLSAV